MEVSTTKNPFRGIAPMYHDTPVLVSVEEAHERMAVCLKCDRYENDICLACGCLIRKKCYFKGVDCLEGKWPKHI